MAGGSNESLGSAYVEVGAHLGGLRDGFAVAKTDAEKFVREMQAILGGVKNELKGSGANRIAVSIDTKAAAGQLKELSGKPIPVNVVVAPGSVNQLSNTLSEAIAEQLKSYRGGSGSGGRTAKSTMTYTDPQYKAAVEANLLGVQGISPEKYAAQHLREVKAELKRQESEQAKEASRIARIDPMWDYRTARASDLSPSGMGKWESEETFQRRQRSGKASAQNPFFGLSPETEHAVANWTPGIGQKTESALDELVSSIKTYGKRVGTENDVLAKEAKRAEKASAASAKAASGNGGGPGGGGPGGGGPFSKNPLSVWGIAKNLGVPVAGVVIANEAIRIFSELAEASDTAAHPERIAREFEKPGAYYDRGLVQSQSQIIANAEADKQRIEAFESVPVLGNIARLVMVGRKAELADTEFGAKRAIEIGEYNRQAQFSLQLEAAQRTGDTLKAYDATTKKVVEDARSTADTSPEEARIDDALLKKRMNVVYKKEFGGTPSDEMESSVMKNARAVKTLDLAKAIGDADEIRQAKIDYDLAFASREAEDRRNILVENPSIMDSLRAKGGAKVVLQQKEEERAAGRIPAAAQFDAHMNSFVSQVKELNHETRALEIIRRGGSRESALQETHATEFQKLNEQLITEAALAKGTVAENAVHDVGVALTQHMEEKQAGETEQEHRESSIRIGTNLAQARAYALEAGRDPFAAKMAMQKEANAAELQSPEYRNAGTIEKIAVNFRQAAGMQATTIEHFRQISGDMISLEAERATAEDRTLHRPLTADARQVAANAQISLMNADVEHFQKMKEVQLAKIAEAREDVNPIKGGAFAQDSSPWQVVGDPLGLTGRELDRKSASSVLSKAQTDVTNAKGPDMVPGLLQEANRLLYAIGQKIGVYPQ